jgi:hypothetical protein
MHDTRQSLAAEAHTHAAYEHWVADYQLKKGEQEAAQEFARRAFEHSTEAAILSEEAFRQEPAAVSGAASGQGAAGRTREPISIARRDTKHALAAELHTNAAYEHWVAHYRLKGGDETLARDFARRAFDRSKSAAALSIEALQEEPSNEGILSVAAD